MLKLVTISRISKEKGFERMLQLEQMLEASGVKFLWDCYGDTSNNYARGMVPKFKHVKFKGITHDPLAVVKQYDFLVQLSNTEGFCYSIYEAISQNVPVIVTRYDSVDELVIDGQNGVILDMDLKDFSPDRLQALPKEIPFTEKSTEKDWINFLNMTKVKTTPPASGSTSRAKVKVRVTKKYHDLKMSKDLLPGFEFKASKERAAELESNRVAVIVP